MRVLQTLLRQGLALSATQPRLLKLPSHTLTHTPYRSASAAAEMGDKPKGMAAKGEERLAALLPDTRLPGCLGRLADVRRGCRRWIGVWREKRLWALPDRPRRQRTSGFPAPASASYPPARRLIPTPSAGIPKGPEIPDKSQAPARPHAPALAMPRRAPACTCGSCMRAGTRPG